MDFKVIYYFEEDGTSPVDDYVQELNDQQIAKVNAYLELLEERGYNLKRPQGDSLGSKTSLYELRPGRHRILYCFIHRKYIVLLHALLKKSDEIPKGDIEMALKRKKKMEEWIESGRLDVRDWGK